MNLRNTVCLLVASSASLAFGDTSAPNSDSRIIPGVVVTQSLSSTNLWPHEMVYVQTVITNTTDVPVTRTVIALGIAKIKIGEAWEYSLMFDDVECSPPEPDEIVLPAHGSFMIWTLIGQDKDRDTFFAQPGTYEIKSFTAFGDSEVDQVTVRPLPDVPDGLPPIPGNASWLLGKQSVKSLCIRARHGSRGKWNPWEMPFVKTLESLDIYADWLQATRIWIAENDTESWRPQPENAMEPCRALIRKYEGRHVPEDRNPIPLVWAYIELAKGLCKTGKKEEAGRIIVEARAKFAHNPALLCHLVWETYSIPQTPPSPRPVIWWESTPDRVAAEK